MNSRSNTTQINLRIFLKIIHEVASTIAKIPDQVKQGVYIQFAGRLLKIDESILRNALKQAILAKSQQDRRSQRIQKQREERERNKRQQLTARFTPEPPATDTSTSPPTDAPPDYDVPPDYLETGPPTDMPPDIGAPPIDESDYIPEVGFDEGMFPEVQAPAIIQPSISTGALDHQERELLRILINYHDKLVGDEVVERKAWDEVVEQMDPVPLVDFFQEGLEGLNFDNPVYEEIKNKIFDQFKADGKADMDYFLHHASPEISATVKSFLTIPYEVSKGWEKFDIKAPRIDQNKGDALTDAITYYKLFKVKKLLKESQTKIRNSTDPQEQEELTIVYLHLLEMRQEIEKEKGIIGGIDANITKL